MNTTFGDTRNRHKTRRLGCGYLVSNVLYLQHIYRRRLSSLWLLFFTSVDCIGHSTSRSLAWHLRASCLSTCLLRIPPQENFAPTCIRSKIASSPSRLM